MKKFLKISGIFLGAIIVIISGFCIYITYFFDFNTFSKTIKNKIYKVSNKYVYFDSATFSFKHGVGIKLTNLEVFNNDNKTKIFSAKRGYINFKFKPLIHKKIEISKIFLENGNLLLNFKHQKSKKETSKESKNIKKSEKTSLPKIKLNYLILKNFYVHYIDNHLNIISKNFYLRVKDFSFKNPFPFELYFVSITGNGLKGRVDIKGKFNFNNSFSHKKMFINAKIRATNLYGPQFYTYFIKKAHFKVFSGNIALVDSTYSGDFNANFSAKGVIKLKNFQIQHENFQKKISTKFLTFSYNYKMSGGHRIDLKEFNLNIDNRLKFNGNFRLKNRDVFINAKSETFSTDEIDNYSPYRLNFVKFNGGELKVENFKLKGSRIYTSILVSKVSGKVKDFNFDNLTGNIVLDKNVINYSGNIEAFLKNYKIKDISLNSLKASFNISKIYIPLKNFKKSKIYGALTLNARIDYKKYKNIELSTTTAKINGRKITSNFKVKYNGVEYLCSGNFSEDSFNLNVSFDSLDKTLKNKFKIKKINNFIADLNIQGNFKKINLKNINVKFKNGDFFYDKYLISNINGNIYCNGINETCSFNKLKFVYDGINYSLSGKLTDFLKPQRILKLKINADGIDKLVLKKLKLSDKNLKNVDVTGDLTIKFKPKFNFKLNNATVIFHNTDFIYDNYSLHKIKGKIVIRQKKLYFQNLSLIYNNIKYNLAGSIPDIYNEKSLLCYLNVKTNKIDREILKKIGINIDSVKNVKLDLNLKVGITPKFSVLIKKGRIYFVNSKIHYISPDLLFKDLKGEIFIVRNNLKFHNLRAKFNNGKIKVNGIFEKNYLNVDVNGENLIFNYKTDKSVKNKTISTKKTEKTGKIGKIIKTLKEFAEKVQGEVKFNFKNIVYQNNRFKLLSGEIKFYNKILTLERFTAKNGGDILIKKFLFDFSKKENIFILKANIDNLDAAIFTNNKISGKTKNCIIDLSSKFKNPDNFLKNFNGMVFMNIQNGIIKKFTFLGNLFSILNVSQIFKLKLPDLTTQGLKYKIMAGKFNVINGVFKTDKFVLLSNSINLGFKGKFNISNKKIRGELVVQPLQTVGNIIGKIPVIGYFFGKKIILFYFKIRGTYENPKVSLQPTKTITKKTFNIFKKIFTLPKNILTNPNKIFLPEGSSK